MESGGVVAPALPCAGRAVSTKPLLGAFVVRHQDNDFCIVNDPNKWLAECGNERYIVDLVCRVVTVSMETLKIVAKLPRLTF